MTPGTGLAKSIYLVGGVAQLGERLNGIQEAVSSILSTSTTSFKGLRKVTVSPFLLPSLFVPVLCQFFNGGEVKSGEIEGG